MSETLPLPRIVELLVLQTGCTPEDAQAFLVEFADLVGDGLVKSDYVAVNGIGTFRRTVGTNGCDVAFVPDDAMAYEINAPFAMFDPVELDDGVTEEMLENAAEAEADNATDEAESVGVDVGGIKEEITQDADSPSESVEALDEPVAEVIIGQADTVQETMAAEPPVEASPKESVTEPQPQSDSEPENVITPATSPASTSRPSEPPVPEQSAPLRRPHFMADDIAEDNDVRHISRHSSHKAHGIVIIIVVGLLSLLIGMLVGYFGHGLLNFKGVRSVNILAEDVQVYHNNSGDVPLDDSDAEIVEVTDSNLVAAAETGTNPAADKTATLSEYDSKYGKQMATAVTDTVKAGRFLTTIAQRHYGKKKFWVYIYLENSERLGNPDLIPPMTVVTVPPLEKYGIHPGDKEADRDAERKAAEILSRF